jgi:hypothetical protein
MRDDGHRVLTDRKLSESTDQRVIDVPFERVDLAGWLFSLASVEFQRCCAPDHIAYGFTTTEDGRPLPVVVELIGGALLVEPFEALVHRSDCCELVSLADVRLPTGWRTRAQITWTASVEALDDDRSTYTNAVTAYATEDFLRVLERTDTPFEVLAATQQAASTDHSDRETPGYAESVARWAHAAGRAVA